MLGKVPGELPAAVTSGGTAGRVTAAHSDTENSVCILGAAIAMAAHR